MTGKLIDSSSLKLCIYTHSRKKKRGVSQGKKVLLLLFLLLHLFSLPPPLHPLLLPLFPLYLQTTGDAKRYNTADDDNFSQVGTFWRKVLSEEEKTRLVQNIAGHLKDATEFIQHRAVSACITRVRHSLVKPSLRMPSLVQND